MRTSRVEEPQNQRRRLILHLRVHRYPIRPRTFLSTNTRRRRACKAERSDLQLALDLCEVRDVSLVGPSSKTTRTDECALSSPCLQCLLYGIERGVYVSSRTWINGSAGEERSGRRWKDHLQYQARSFNVYEVYEATNCTHCHCRLEIPRRHSWIPKQR